MMREEIIGGGQGIAELMFLLLFAVLVSPHNENGQVIFLQWCNVTDILRQVAEIGIIALAMTLVSISGGIDLSVGSMLAFAASLSAMLLTWQRQNQTGYQPSAIRFQSEEALRADSCVERISRIQSRALPAGA